MPWKQMNRRKGLVLLVLPPLLVVFFVTGAWKSSPRPGRLEEGIVLLASPLQEGTSSLLSFFRGIGDYLPRWKKTKRENEELRREVVLLRRLLSETAEREKSYYRLEKILDYRKQSGFQMTVASVIGRDATNIFKTISINKGRVDGVRYNQAVISPDGLVGRVIKVYSRSAKVLLLVDRSFGVDALIQRTRDQGFVLGSDPERCEMKYLSRQAEVTEGDLVISSGMGEVFPKGIKIGRVSHARKGGNLLQNVEIKPSVAFDRLEEVIVVIKDEEPAE